MALFFDSQWFDAQMGALGLKRADLAAALGLDASEIAEVWKDQRELTVANVRLIASLLGVPAVEVASHAGVSTPVPREDSDDIERRLARLEAEIAEIRSLLKAER